MKKFALTFIFLGSFTIFAQEPVKGDYNITAVDSNYYKRIVAIPEADNVEIDGFSFPEIENYDGTYQFLPEKIKKYKITPEMLLLIEQNRRESEDVNLKLDDDLTVFIPSENKIISLDFKPFQIPYDQRRIHLKKYKK